MNSDDRRSGIPADNNGADGDDEFGEFEGFDGVSLDSLPAAAGPSPWATFPDLLPVQTSSASGAVAADDPSGLQSQRDAEQYNGQMWLGGAVGGTPHLARSAPVALLQHASRHMTDGALANSPAISYLNQVSPRTVNPPDISLSACPSSLPYSALEAELHPSRSSPHQGQHGAAVPSMQQQQQHPLLQEQVASLQEQLTTVQAQKAEMQERLNQVMHQKQDLAARLSHSHSQVAELRIHLQEVQEHLSERERKFSNSNSHNREDLTTTLQQIQESLCALQDGQRTGQNQLESLSQQLKELKDETESKVARVEQEVGERHNASEWHLTQHVTEVANTLKTTLSAALEEGFRQHTLSMENIIQENLHGVSLGSSGPSSSSQQQQFSLESFKSYFEHCIVQHRQMLENERRQQLRTVSRTLETMLAQLSAPEAPDSTTMPDSESDVGKETSSSNTS